MTSLAQLIAPQLPFLRRFARSITGRQDIGDSQVANVLRQVVEDPTKLRPELSPKLALYRLLLANWNMASPSVGTARNTDMATGAADRHLKAITPLPRQAFLLVAMEGFTHQQTASILDLQEADIADLIDTAARQMAEQIATDILIIEDEPLIALDLEHVVTSIGHRVTRVARTRTDALAAFRSRRPGLVLADVQLADGSSGLDAVNDILGEADLPVIFITAYPEQVLTGLRPEPTFLIPKPFQDETVKAVVSQALFFDMRAHSKG